MNLTKFKYAFDNKRYHTWNYYLRNTFGEKVFKVSIIPHTGGETTLLHKKNGETVNLECDVIGKYIEKFMRLKEESGQIKKQLLDETFLRENGFI